MKANCVVCGKFFKKRVNAKTCGQICSAKLKHRYDYDYQRKYRAANPEKTRMYDNKYYAANSEKKREYDRKYRAVNRDKRREYNRKYRAAQKMITNES